MIILFEVVEAEWRIYTSVNCASMGPNNSLSPHRRQYITWINAGTLLKGPMGISFNEILIKDMWHLKLWQATRTWCSLKSFGKCRRSKMLFWSGQIHDVYPNIAQLLTFYISKSPSVSVIFIKSFWQDMMLRMIIIQFWGNQRWAYGERSWMMLKVFILD